MDETIELLDRARRELTLSVTELWWRYYPLGGMATEFELEAILLHALVPSVTDRDLIAVAINERFSEIGRDHPIAYSDD